MRSFASASRKLRKDLLRIVAVAVVSVVTLIAATGRAAGAATGVVWAPRADANTTVAPGAKITFYVYAFNVGDATTDGSTVTAQVTLPPGLTLVSAVSGPATPWTCSGASGSAVASCTSTQAFSPEPTGHGPPDLEVTVRASTDPSLATGTKSVHVEVSGGGPGAVPGSAYGPVRFSSTQPVFGIAGFDEQLSDASGATFTRAGGHPYEFSTEIRFNSGADATFGEMWPPEAARDIVTDLPPGLIGNPTAVEQCTAGELANSEGFNERPLCPTGSQIGVATVVANYANRVSGEIYNPPVSVFNMVPPPSVPARLGFNIAGTVVTLDAHPRGSDYGISVDVQDSPEALAILETDLTIWGVPGDPSHDFERSCPGEKEPANLGPTCQSDIAPKPFLRDPTSCTAAPGSPVPGGMAAAVHVDTWQHTGAVLPDGSPDLSDPAWKSAQVAFHESPGFPASPEDPLTPWGAPVLPTGCGAVPFGPSLSDGPVGPAAAGSPAPFAFDLTMPQEETSEGVAESDLRKAVVTLPEGVRISPSAAHGLEGCTSGEIALGSNVEPSCPDASKIGTVTLQTPLLEQPMHGYVYQAAPHDNPFGSLLAIYIVAKGSGVTVKLPGRIDADPVTGRLTTAFDDQPQLPFSKLHMEFNGGDTAPLVVPSQCGTFTTDAQLTGWNGKTADSTSHFTVSQGPGGSACAPRGFAPGFAADMQNPVAGAFSPFVLQLTRSDSDQELSSISSVTLPPGLLANIGSVPRCSDGQAAAASCPVASRLGNVTVGSGPGAKPFYITDGNAYLTGPYKGSPFGMAFIVHAAAGPFDLGAVVVRAALRVDSHTAQATIESDPFPSILQGIPLQVRDVRVSIDRPGFTFNPTNCQEQHIAGAATSTQGTTAALSTRFQVGGCAKLAFKPSFAVSTSAETSRRNGASLHVILKASAGQANIAKVDVQVPKALSVRDSTLNQACTETQFTADPAGCPAGSFVGTATAHTPILAKPLTGPAIFVSHGGAKFPDMDIVLQGEGITIVLIGKTAVKKGRLLSYFDTAPDAPISRFDLTLPQGPHSALAANGNLCTSKKTRLIMPTTIDGQNGAVTHHPTNVSVNGCGKHKAKHRTRRK